MNSCPWRGQLADLSHHCAKDCAVTQKYKQLHAQIARMEGISESQAVTIDSWRDRHQNVCERLEQKEQFIKTTKSQLADQGRDLREERLEHKKTKAAQYKAEEEKRVADSKIEDLERRVRTEEERASSLERQILGGKTIESTFPAVEEMLKTLKSLRESHHDPIRQALVEHFKEIHSEWQTAYRSVCFLCVLRVPFGKRNKKIAIKSLKNSYFLYYFDVTMRWQSIEKRFMRKFSRKISQQCAQI